MRFPALPLAALALILTALPARADLRERLSVFFDLGPQDSVVALAQTSATALQVETVDMTTTERRTQEEEVGAKPLARLLEEARTAGVPVTGWTAPAGAANPPERAADPETPGDPTAGPAGDPVRRSAGSGSQSKNRFWYMSTQFLVSTYIYGGAIPEALDVESVRIRTAIPLLIAPVAFGAHFWFAKSRPFEDAHLSGTTYLSTAALYASYALPFALMDPDSERFRTAAYVSLATYPLGIWGGYLLGDKYVDLPGRIGTQSKFALGFGTLGFFSPFLYFEDLEKNDEAIFRLALGQSVGFAAAGHFISEFYRTGENIPGGVTTGILTHTALGAGIGAEIAALSDASGIRPWFGAALAGGTLGFMEGLWYFRNRYDSNERGFYNILGAGAGMLMGSGVLLLVYDDDASDYAEKVVPTSLLLGGALIGYMATDILTGGMEDRPQPGTQSLTPAKPSRWTDRLAFNPIPYAEPQVQNRELYFRYRMKGLSFTF